MSLSQLEAVSELGIGLQSSNIMGGSLKNRRRDGNHQRFLATTIDHNREKIVEQSNSLERMMTPAGKVLNLERPSSSYVRKIWLKSFSKS